MHYGINAQLEKIISDHFPTVMIGWLHEHLAEIVYSTVVYMKFLRHYNCLIELHICYTIMLTCQFSAVTIDNNK